MSTIFIMFMLGWISYLAIRLLMSAPHVDKPASSGEHQARPDPSIMAAWDALDDHQLTRLLIDAAAGTNDE